MPRFQLSNHPGANFCYGENWATQVINTIMKSPAWKSTAIFLTWDSGGGFYDHVKPPTIDHCGHGFRVPLIMLSPYAKQGYIDHSTGEFDSMLKFIEDNWGLAPLTSRDANAPSLADAFDFSQAPTEARPAAVTDRLRGPEMDDHPVTEPAPVPDA